jgi:hypothetical protein
MKTFYHIYMSNHTHFKHGTSMCKKYEFMKQQFWMISNIELWNETFAH